MKAAKLITIIAIILAIGSVECNAQPPALNRLREGPPPGGPGSPGAPLGPGRLALQQVTAFQGQVGEWTNNDDYLYDGFYLQTAQGKSLVKFPPHMGAQLTKAIKTGSAITVNGIEETNPEGIKEIRMVSIVAGGQTFQDVPMAAPLADDQQSSITGSGKITALQKGRENEVNGFIVDGKTILRVPPHVALQLSNLVTTGSTVTFTGMKKANNNGEASAGNYSIVHCETITVNGTQYLTR